METESEKTLRIIEYWKTAYDEKNKNKNDNRSIYDIGSIDFKDDDNNDRRPYEPTAVLAKAPPNQPPTKRFSIDDISTIRFTT